LQCAGCRAAAVGKRQLPGIQALTTGQLMIFIRLLGMNSAVYICNLQPVGQICHSALSQIKRPEIV
jgi:hypothetical protein